MNIEIIAEIGTSHGNNFDKAKQLIDASITAGATAVKFQWVYADEILHPNTGSVKLPTGSITLYNRFKELENTPDFYNNLKEYANKQGTKFICSPFGLKSLEQLYQINPAAIKIASPELNHFPLLKKLVELEKKNTVPIILSSGVAKIADIEKALTILSPIDKKNISLLHCVTSYPAPETDYNLRVLPNLKNIFDITVGVSDHSLHPFLIPLLSVLQGGTIIEKHITLSKTTEGLDDPVALTIPQFKKMTEKIKEFQQNSQETMYQSLYEEFGIANIEKILGTGEKKLAESEKNNYSRTNRSLHYLHNLPKGHKISEQDIAILRTEKILSVGLTPDFYEILLGKTLTKNVNNGDGVQLEDFLF